MSVEPNTAPHGATVVIKAFVGNLDEGETVRVLFEKGSPQREKLGTVAVTAGPTGEVTAEYSYVIPADDPPIVPMYGSYRLRNDSLMASADLSVAS
jgi:hypothetical protein